MHRRTFLLVLLLSWGVDLGAQENPVDLSTGARVRVAAPPLQESRLVGLVLLADSDSLVLSASKPYRRLVFPLSSLQTVEVSEGRSRFLGAGIGALVGLVGGLGLGVMCTKACPTGGGANMAVVGGLFYGPPLGAVLGALLAPERWRSIPLSRGEGVRTQESRNGGVRPNAGADEPSPVTRRSTLVRSGLAVPHRAPRPALRGIVPADDASIIEATREGDV